MYIYIIFVPYEDSQSDDEYKHGPVFFVCNYHTKFVQYTHIVSVGIVEYVENVE